jgi:kynurenine 3-monooxygenase
METILIVGGGLVGSVLAMHLARFCEQVAVFDYRPDPRNNRQRSGRSINLTLCERGFHALEAIGVADEIRALSVPAYGRVIHDASGGVTYQPYGSRGEALYSISREDLNCACLTLAEERFGVQARFGQKCVQVDVGRPAACFLDARTGEIVAQEATRLIGADGVHSAVRLQMQKSLRFNYSQEYIEQEYKELTVPPTAAEALERNALHFWPRGHYMLIGFPNLDGSFTLSLHLPLNREPSFDSIATAVDLLGLFEESFPDVVPLLPTLVEDFFRRPTNSMVTTRCFPWTHEGKVALVGDAAHAIVPSYGQGANAGFEDCVVLCECLEASDGDWQAAFQDYERRRKPNAEAIADLALEHFREIRDLVGDPEFQLRKSLERRLAERYPDVYTPLYNLVSFTNISYVEALRIEARQKPLVDRLLALEAVGRMLETGEIDRHIDELLRAAEVRCA